MSPQANGTPSCSFERAICSSPSFNLSPTPVFFSFSSTSLCLVAYSSPRCKHFVGLYKATTDLLSSCRHLPARPKVVPAATCSDIRSISTLGPAHQSRFFLPLWNGLLSRPIHPSRLTHAGRHEPLTDSSHQDVGNIQDFSLQSCQSQW